MGTKRTHGILVAAVSALGCLAMLAPRVMGEEKPAASDLHSRVKNRDFPSIFQAWNKADKGPGVSGNEITDCAKHDLYWTSTFGLKLKWKDGSPNDWTDDGRGTSFTEASIGEARAYVSSLRAANPNIVILAEIRYWCAWGTYLPEDSPWWKRSGGSKEVAWAGEGTPWYYMDWNNADFRNQVALQSKAVCELDFIDGVMIDCMTMDCLGDADNEVNRVDIIKRIRENIGDKLIIANGSYLKRPNIGKYINGVYMECWMSSTEEQWLTIADTLKWAESSLVEPRVNCLEVWYDTNRNNEYKMRAVTTLALTLSNGYVLFADPNDCFTPDHLHDWYSFWDTDLGKPIAQGYQRADTEIYQREYTKGTVIFNPKGKGQRAVTFAEDRKSAASGATGKTFTVNENDGDIFTYTGAAPETRSSAQAMLTDYYPASICSQQGISNWHTQYTPDGSTFSDMTWAEEQPNTAALHRLKGGGLYVFGAANNNGARLDAITTDNKIAVKWVAPHGGTVVISGPAYKAFAENDDGVTLTIRKNKTVIAGPRAVTLKAPPVELSAVTSVAAGDEIICIADSNASANNDIFFWKLKARLYLDGEPPAEVTAALAEAANAPVAAVDAAPEAVKATADAVKAPVEAKMAIGEEDMAAAEENLPPAEPGSAETMFDDAICNNISVHGIWANRELGVQFKTSVKGIVTHVKLFAGAQTGSNSAESGVRKVRFYRNSDGAIIAGPFDVDFGTGENKWVTADIPDVRIRANTLYTLSISTGLDTSKSYINIPGVLQSAGSNGKSLSWPANAGVAGAPEAAEINGVMPAQGTWSAVPNGTTYGRDIVFVPNGLRP